MSKNVSSVSCSSNVNLIVLCIWFIFVMNVMNSSLDPVHMMIYRRSGFNCEYLLNANCEDFKTSQLIDSQK